MSTVFGRILDINSPALTGAVFPEFPNSARSGANPEHGTPYSSVASLLADEAIAPPQSLRFHTIEVEVPGLECNFR